MPFAAFVALGSTALAFWLHLSARTQSLAAFAEEGRTNAEFVRAAHLAQSERTAESLSRVLGVQVFFVRTTDGLESLSQSLPGRDLVALQPSTPANLGKAVRGRGWEVVAQPLADDWQMWFARPAHSDFSGILQLKTVAVLGGFWMLALALGVALSRGIVSPLRQLARRLPQIENDPEASLPGAERTDEIGQLARAYLETRSLLAEERVRREKAERLALLGRMATGLAHEIHNPLSAIRMHAQLLESSTDDELTATAAESLPLILSETKKIESLVSQWMFLARPEPPKTRELDLREVVDSVVRTHELTANHAGVRVTVGLPDEIWIRGDERRLDQSLSNVFLNAVQAMPEGGDLRIDGEKIDGGRFALRVRDSGTGFSPAAIEHHADLFFTEKEGGMGIGLSVASEIVRAHQGALRVENRAGGAVVTFEIPVITKT